MRQRPIGHREIRVGDRLAAGCSHDHPEFDHLALRPEIPAPLLTERHEQTPLDLAHHPRLAKHGRQPSPLGRRQQVARQFDRRLIKRLAGDRRLRFLPIQAPFPWVAL
jgi:hypothetical protein